MLPNERRRVGTTVDTSVRPLERWSTHANGLADDLTGPALSMLCKFFRTYFSRPALPFLGLGPFQFLQRFAQGNGL